MNDTEWPPDVIAVVDQLRALIRTMVGWKLEHDADGDCQEMCPGGAVQDLLEGLSRETVNTLAALMVCELAKERASTK